MKFGKDIEQDLVPEWRAKYLEYRLAKKKIKAVSRAINSSGGSSPSQDDAQDNPSSTDSADSATQLLKQPRENRDNANQDGSVTDESSSSGDAVPASLTGEIPKHGQYHAHVPLAPHTGERSESQRHAKTRYGSIIGTPPQLPNTQQITNDIPPDLSLGEPALTSAKHSEAVASSSSSVNDPHISFVGEAGSRTRDEDHDTVGTKPRSGKMGSKRRTFSMPTVSIHRIMRPLTERVKSLGSDWGAGRGDSHKSPSIWPNETSKEIETRQRAFFGFLDSELEKIDGFYKEKEEEATRRVHILRDQLHKMRDRRMSEVNRADRPKGYGSRLTVPQTGNETNVSASNWSSSHNLIPDIPLLKSLDRAVEQAKVGRVGKTYEAMKKLGTPPGPSPIDLYRDYTMKAIPSEASYKTAKHKLKVALAEFYHRLELLKSYAELNRKAFVKITKKYDKVVNSRAGRDYMVEVVNHAYFVKSEQMDRQAYDVEDLYARYFERGNRKVAASKLRAKITKEGEFSSSAFKNGFMLAGGAVLAIEAVVEAASTIRHGSKEKSIETGFLLQLYAGYFLVVLMSLLYCISARAWQKAKVNFIFVFEFDTRRGILDWRQLTQMPSFFFFIMSLTMWINLHSYGGPTMYIYWPVVLIGISLIALFIPLPIFYPYSRSWLIRTLGRLSTGGLLPVEFRDFFLGDLFCSLIYAMANFEVFICLYAQRPPWQDPSMCSASRSRALGFLATVPGIWRALQCVRRFWDTKNIFPHLVNCGKYICTIMQYMTLSLYRIDERPAMKALFITFATINGIYCSVWDLGMDFSLLDPYAKHKFLRHNLAFKRIWPYYAVIILDPILRFNWLLYAFYTEDPRHAAIVSFFVSLAEVLRRGMWMIFRVENEHCANVGRFRAYRDAPLPYALPGSHNHPQAPQNPHPIPNQDEEHGMLPEHHDPGKLPVAPTTGAEYQNQATQDAVESTPIHKKKGHATGSSVVAQAMARAGAMMHLAHTQDFEKRRRPSHRSVHADEISQGGFVGEDRDAEGDDDYEEAIDDEHADSEDNAKSPKAERRRRRSSRKS